MLPIMNVPVASVSFPTRLAHISKAACLAHLLALPAAYYVGTFSANFCSARVSHWPCHHSDDGPAPSNHHHCMPHDEMSDGVPKRMLSYPHHQLSHNDVLPHHIHDSSPSLHCPSMNDRC